MVEYLSIFICHNVKNFLKDGICLVECFSIPMLYQPGKHFELNLYFPHKLEGVKYI